MNPSPAAVAWIQGQVGAMSGAWTNTNAQIVTTLNTTLAANPTPQATVPKPYTVQTVMGALAASSQKNVAGYVSLSAVLDSVNAGDTPGVLTWASVLEMLGLITSTDVSAVQSLVTATELDPTWQSQLPISVINLGRLVDQYDVQAARA